MQTKKILSGLFVAAVVITAFSCNKIGPAKAIVKVVDANNKPVSGATVRLHADELDGVKDPNSVEKVSGASGLTQFEFKNEAIWSIDATYISVISDSTGTYTDTLKGKGIIRLEKDKTVEQTVTVTQ